MDLPAFYKAAVVNQEGPQKRTFNVTRLPLPTPQPWEVLVELSVSGVCGTDVALASGELGPCKSILGHEGVGRVVQLGEHVSPSEIALGARVGIAWTRDVCGKCVMCLADGGETRCLEQYHSGRKIDGTFAQYSLVPSRYVIRLPEDLADELIAPILCGGVTIYKAFKVSGATPGRWIVISGAAGGVGALGIQYGKAMGYRIIAIDAGAQKGELCMESGAEAYVDLLTDSDPIKSVQKITGAVGPAAALVVAGVSQVYQDALEMLGLFGTLVCVGIPPPHSLVNFHPLTFIDKGINVIGSAVGTRQDILEALTFV